MIMISKHVALNAFLAIGMTFVIITSGIDLSVGSIVGRCGTVAGGLILSGVDLGFLGVGYTLCFAAPEIMLITLGLGVPIGSAGISSPSAAMSRRPPRPASASIA